MFCSVEKGILVQTLACKGLILILNNLNYELHGLDRIGHVSPKLSIVRIPRCFKVLEATLIRLQRLAHTHEYTPLGVEGKNVMLVILFSEPYVDVHDGLIVEW